MSVKDNYLKLSEKFGGPYSLVKKGIKRGLIDSIVQGKDVRISNVKQIAEALGVTVGVLVGEKKPEDLHKDRREPFNDVEREYVRKLLDILRGTNDQAKAAIMFNIDTFHPLFSKEEAVDTDYLKKLKACRKEPKAEEIKKTG